MAVRGFDGVDDTIKFTGTLGPLNKTSPFTLLLLVKVLSLPSTSEGLCGFGRPGTSYCCPYQNSSSASLIWGSADPGVDVSFSTGPTANTWGLASIRKAAGNVAPVGSWAPLGGSWTHSTAGSAVAASTGADPTEFVVGNFQDGSGFRDQRVALAALMPSSLSNTDLTTILTGASTDAVNDFLPVMLLEFTQASVGTPVVDLIGTVSQTSITGTTAVTGDDPTWTFGLPTQILRPTADTDTGGWSTPPLHPTLSDQSDVGTTFGTLA